MRDNALPIGFLVLMSVASFCVVASSKTLWGKCLSERQVEAEQIRLAGGFK